MELTKAIMTPFEESSVAESLSKASVIGLRCAISGRLTLIDEIMGDLKAGRTSADMVDILSEAVLFNIDCVAVASGLLAAR